MGGFSLGLGVGLRYPAPNRKIKVSEPIPEPEPTSVLLSETNKAILTENNDYVKLEESTPSVQTLSLNSISETEGKTKARKTKTTTTKKTTKKNDKSYWNF